MAKEGSTISGLMDSMAMAVSLALQYGVPLSLLVDKFFHLRFEPSGWTGNRQIPYAKSIMDYIFRWLGAKFLGPEYAVTEAGESPSLRPTESDPQQALPFARATPDAPLCAECGSVITRNGSCYLQLRQLRRRQRLQLELVPFFGMGAEVDPMAVAVNLGGGAAMRHGVHRKGQRLVILPWRARSIMPSVVSTPMAFPFGPVRLAASKRSIPAPEPISSTVSPA